MAITNERNCFSVMAGIQQLNLTVWNATETRKFLTIDLRAAKFNDPLKRMLEVKNITRAFVVSGRKDYSFRMWPHPHDIVQAWEDGQNIVEVVGAMISVRDAPDEEPHRLAAFQAGKHYQRTTWWYPRMPAMGDNFRHRVPSGQSTPPPTVPQAPRTPAVDTVIVGDSTPVVAPKRPQEDHNEPSVKRRRTWIGLLAAGTFQQK